MSTPRITAREIGLDYPVIGVKSAGPKPEDKDADITKNAGAILAAQGKISTVTALQDVSFDLVPGDRLGLVGRNGSGKSTLLRILGGIYEPSRGSLDVVGDTSALFRVGLGTRTEATGRKNIILRGLLKGLSRREAEEKVPDIAEFSGLGPFLDMPVRTYSTGMAMRLSFAIATAFSPEILLLDEWIGAGDAEFQEKAKQRMHNLVAEAGITVIASHNRSLIRNVCTKALWLHQGIMRAYGPIDEVYQAIDDAKQNDEM